MIELSEGVYGFDFVFLAATLVSRASFDNTGQRQVRTGRSCTSRWGWDGKHGNLPWEAKIIILAREREQVDGYRMPRNSQDVGDANL